MNFYSFLADSKFEAYYEWMTYTIVFGFYNFCSLNTGQVENLNTFELMRLLQPDIFDPKFTRDSIDFCMLIFFLKDKYNLDKIMDFKRMYKKLKKK